MSYLTSFENPSFSNKVPSNTEPQCFVWVNTSLNGSIGTFILYCSITDRFVRKKCEFVYSSFSSWPFGSQPAYIKFWRVYCCIFLFRLLFFNQNLQSVFFCCFCCCSVSAPQVVTGWVSNLQGIFKSKCCMVYLCGILDMGMCSYTLVLLLVISKVSARRFSCLTTCSSWKMVKLGFHNLHLMWCISIAVRQTWVSEVTLAAISKPCPLHTAASLGVESNFSSAVCIYCKTLSVFDISF